MSDIWVAQASSLHKNDNILKKSRQDACATEGEKKRMMTLKQLSIKYLLATLIRGKAFARIKHTPKSLEVGQPSPVDIIMTSGAACPTDRGDFCSPL